jgi:hypothetical protein
MLDRNWSRVISLAKVERLEGCESLAQRLAQERKRSGFQCLLFGALFKRDFR